MEKSQQETQSQDFKFKEADEAPDEELRFKGIYFNPLQQANNLRRLPPPQSAVQKKKDTHSSAWRDKMKRQIDQKQHSEQQERAQLKQLQDTDEQNNNAASEHTSGNSGNGTSAADNQDLNNGNNNNKLNALKDNYPSYEANTATTQLTKSPTEVMNNNKTALRQATSNTMPNSDSKYQQQNCEQNEQEDSNNLANNQASLAKKSTSLNNLNNDPLNSQQLQQINNRGRCSQMKIGGTCTQKRNNRKRRRQQSKGLTQQLNSGLPQKSLKLFQASNSKSSGSSENEDDLDDDLEEERQGGNHQNFFQNNNISNLLENINANHMNNNNNLESQQGGKLQNGSSSSIKLAQQQQNGQRNHLFFDRLDRKSSVSSSNSEIEECFPQNKPLASNTNNNNPGKSNGFNKWGNIFDKNNNNNSSIDKGSLQKCQSSNDSLEELPDTQPNQILRSQALAIPSIATTNNNNNGASKILGQNGINSAVSGVTGLKQDQYFLRTKLVKQLDSEDSEITVKIEQVNIKPFQTFIAEIIAINHLSQDINDSDVTLAVKQYVQGLVKQTYHIQHSLQVGKMYSFKFKTLLKNDHFPILNVDEYTLVQ